MAPSMSKPSLAPGASGRCARPTHQEEDPGAVLPLQEAFVRFSVRIVKRDSQGTGEQPVDVPLPHITKRILKWEQRSDVRVPHFL